MITDDTILEKLRWQQFDNNKSYNVAKQKYDDILLYVFPGLDTTNFRTHRDEININQWRGVGRCFRGINLNFWNDYERRTCFRCIEFKGTAKDFKAKVLEKFEALKSLRQEADKKYINQKHQEVASELEIIELTEIAKRAFEKYKVTIIKNACAEGYTLKLEKYFSDKREFKKLIGKVEHRIGRRKSLYSTQA